MSWVCVSFYVTILSRDFLVTYIRDMDAIFKSLADPTRRMLLDRLRQKDGQTLQELEEACDMTRFGVMKHLAVLEEAGLIVTRKQGRFKHHYLNAVPLQEAIDRWIEPFVAKPVARGMIDLKRQLEGQDMIDVTAPDLVAQTFIRCTQDALWDALTDAKSQEAYNFTPGTVERDGETLTFRFPDQSEMLICRETRLDPKTRIESTFEPKWAPGVPESRIVYLIEPEGAHCKLTVEHYDLTAEVEGIRDGWDRTLAGLKSWLETGEVVKFSSETPA
jgi:DNA-binding transcriptional ArsR family regulator/uncharacterized protein YndB with AHSA1/START domain